MLKGLNPVQGGTLTNGTDTTQPFPVAQNAYGFSLHYYNGDYKAIGYTPQSSSILGALGASASPLYNGNIAAMGVNIPRLGSAKVYNYHYDQLNRLVAMDAYNGLNPNTGSFTPVSVNDYQERAAYDPNGNILTYQRNGDAARLSMDNLSYYYKGGSNQLQKVTDAAADATTNYSLYNDIRQGQLDNNYQYDATGNLTGDASEGISNIGWTVYGKISSITKGGSTINYSYDASGNRLIKSTAIDTTVYVRDGSGNVMSVYVKKAGGSLVQAEMPIYGSSRLGMATQHLAPDTSLLLAGGFGTAIKSTFTRGEKFFELSNHLGNVLATLTDRRMQNSAAGVNVDYYTADIMAANDYYPGGMQMPGRKYSSGSTYRYGFNGKENDRDVKGDGNQYDYGMRGYDPRLGRFLSVDPLIQKYPELTPYQYSSDNPVALIDFDGMEGSKPKVIGNTWPKTSYLTAEQINANVNSIQVTGIPISYLKDLLKGEGVTLKMYDVDQNDRSTPASHGGNATIGVGHLIHLGAIGSSQYDKDALNKEEPFKKGLTLDEVFTMFGNDVQVRVNGVNKNLKALNLPMVDENTKAVFVDLRYNTPSRERPAEEIYKKGAIRGGDFGGDISLYNSIKNNIIKSVSEERKKIRLNSIEKAIDNDLKRSRIGDDPRDIKRKFKESKNDNSIAIVIKFELNHETHDNIIVIII